MTDWKRTKPVDDSGCVMRPTAKGWTAQPPFGRLSEWFKEPALNTGDGLCRPQVRILHLPLVKMNSLVRFKRTLPCIQQGKRIMRVLNSDGGEFTDDDIGKIPVVECTKEEWEACRKPPKERLVDFLNQDKVVIDTLMEWALNRDDEAHGRFRFLVEQFGTPLNYAKEVVYDYDKSEDVFEALELMEKERNDRRNGNDRVDRI